MLVVSGFVDLDMDNVGGFIHLFLINPNESVMDFQTR
ncbi:hypothetical protein BGS_0183 [Beggiatoa sp. SS]|nr:hypothetical protein BGS_0183 [Beggiatoa sp. SS]